MCVYVYIDVSLSIYLNAFILSLSISVYRWVFNLVYSFNVCRRSHYVQKSRTLLLKKTKLVILFWMLLTILTHKHLEKKPYLMISLSLTFTDVNTHAFFLFPSFTQLSIYYLSLMLTFSMMFTFNAETRIFLHIHPLSSSRTFIFAHAYKIQSSCILLYTFNDGLVIFSDIVLMR